MFEMASGFSPAGVMPTEEEYEGVEDEELKRVLRVIFDKETTKAKKVIGF